MPVSRSQVCDNVPRCLAVQHLHPDDQIYYPFIRSTKNIISAAEKSKTVKRVVFTQAGAGLVDSEVGDTYGNEMNEVLDGMPDTIHHIYSNTNTSPQSTSK
jgi:hypothetical protein